MVDPLSLAVYGLGAVSKTIRRTFLVIWVLLLVGALCMGPDVNGKYGGQAAVGLASLFVFWYWLVMSVLAVIKRVVIRDIRQ